MNLKELKQNITDDVFWQITCASLLAISLAYLSEILLNLRPCILCIYQRIPYFFLTFIALLSCYKITWRKYLRHMILLLLSAEIAFAFYHVGVEHYIFEDSHICQDKTQVGSILSTQNLVSSCSDVIFKFMNFSMAEWNLIYSIFLFGYFIYKERRNGFFTR